MKLCLYKVTKSDACKRPFFVNSVTYFELSILESHMKMFTPDTWLCVSLADNGTWNLIWSVCEQVRRQMITAIDRQP